MKHLHLKLISTLLWLAILAAMSSVYGQQRKLPVKNKFQQKLTLMGDFVNASLETSLRFETKNSLASVKIGLENNLGLVKSKIFFSGTALWNITRRSGLIASYYRIHRKKTFTVKREIPYLDKYIPQGTEIDVYFNTNVTSVGYLLTVVTDTKSFLGAYFNLFLMNVGTGVESGKVVLNETLDYLAPLPNFGIFMRFDVLKWLELNGKFGMFYLRLEDFTGKINDFNIQAAFNPLPWLGLNLSYKVFDVSVVIFEKNMNTIVNYNFRGPALGLTLRLLD